MVDGATRCPLAVAEAHTQKTYNNTSGITYFPADSHAPQADFSRSDNDRRNKSDLPGVAHAGHWFDFGVALLRIREKPVNETTGADVNRDSLPLDCAVGVPRNSPHGPALSVHRLCNGAVAIE